MNQMHAISKKEDCSRLTTGLHLKVFGFFFLLLLIGGIAGYDFGPNQFKAVFVQKLSDRFGCILDTEFIHDISSDLLQFSWTCGPYPIEYLLGLIVAQIGLLWLVLE